MKVKLGIDNIFKHYQPLLNRKNIGLVANQASINSSLLHSITLFQNYPHSCLKAVFTPEHGLYGIKEYMDSVNSFYEPSLQLTIHSLYGNDLSPANETLAHIDSLIFDLQDIGVRYYTYTSTMALCMEKCAQLKKEFIVLDRPNPLNGITVQGNILKKGYESFVGKFPVPVRHGLTIGELSLFIKDHLNIDLNLVVIPMLNWKRNMYWDDTNFYWIQPSPNIPHWTTAIFYPGACLLEATNVSEGRGTTKPFELIGAPWIDSSKAAHDLNDLNIPCIQFLPMRFIPKFDKYANELCSGIQICIHDPDADAYSAIIKVIKYLYTTYPEHFKWRIPPYEFNEHIMPFDLLTGTNEIRLAIENGSPINTILKKEYAQLKRYKEKIKQYFLY